MAAGGWRGCCGGCTEKRKGAERAVKMGLGGGGGGGGVMKV